MYVKYVKLFNCARLVEKDTYDRQIILHLFTV